MNEFVIHACEQVLRFTQVGKWNDLSDALKIQLGFNMGVMALGLNLSKEDGFVALSNAREGKITMKELRDHLETIIDLHGITVDETKVMRQF